MSDAARPDRRRRRAAPARAVTATARQFVHVEHASVIPRPVKDLGDVLVERPSSWFPRLERTGVASIGIHVAGMPLRKKVRIEFGEPARTSTWAVVPVSWSATFAETLFPVMTGKVAVASVDANTSRLTVSGVYEPPLGKLGEQLNEAFMRKLAKATVKELAEHIAAHLARRRH